MNNFSEEQVVTTIHSDPLAHLVDDNVESVERCGALSSNYDDYQTGDNIIWSYPVAGVMAHSSVNWGGILDDLWWDCCHCAYSAETRRYICQCRVG